MGRYRRCRYAGCHAMVAYPDHYCNKHSQYEAEYLARRNQWGVRNEMRAKRHNREYNRTTRVRDDVKAEQNKFYHTRQWSSLRHYVLERDHYVCGYCGAFNAGIVDHIVPIEYDKSMMTDADNLTACCRNCHMTKSRWERDYYGTGSQNELKQVGKVTDLKLLRELLKSRESLSKRS